MSVLIRGVMAEYIEREAAIAEVTMMAEARRIPVDSYGGEVVGEVIRLLRGIPAADVRPVVRATWRRYSPFTDTYECSNCGEQVIDQQFRTNFCPNCGADMRET